MLALLLGGAGLLLLAALNLLGVRRLAPYLLVGVAIWVCVLKSGVHATLAGVAVALFVPRGDADRKPAAPPGAHAAPLGELRHHADLCLRQCRRVVRRDVDADLLAPLPLGIAAGLFVGKQIGVFGASWVAIKLGLCRLPDQRVLD